MPSFPYLYCPELFILGGFQITDPVLTYLVIYIWSIHVYVHIVHLTADPYVRCFAEWTFPQNIPCLINSLEQLHFQQCFVKTLRYSKYTRHRQHLAFCVKKRALMIRLSTLFIRINASTQQSKKSMFNAIIYYS